MYSRSYPNPGEGLIPPNYSGNAFDLARERRERASDNNARRQQHEHRHHTESSECDEREHRPKRNDLISSLFSRRDGRRIECDDILLAGLIILLITSGADEEVILLLGFLFLAGL